MTISAAFVFEVRTAGSDTNGGGWKTGASGTDWSQQNAAQYSVTDGITSGTTTITSATANFGTDVVGNLIYVQGGTGSVTAGWYEITARTNSTTITVDRSTGLTAGTSVTLKIGGALASPGQASALMVSSNICYIRGGTYSISNGTANTAGNRVDWPTNTMIFRGYGTTRGDTGVPVLQATAGSITLFGASAGRVGCFVSQIRADGNGQASITGMLIPNLCNAIKCEAINCATGINSGSLNPKLFCYAESCTLGFTGFSAFCVAKSCTTGFSTSQQSAQHGCITWNCTTGFTAGSSQALQTTNCVAYGGTTGFVLQNNNGSVVYNCIAYSTSGKGFSGVVDPIAFQNNAAGSNSGGNDNTLAVSLSGDPFVAAASGNFALNNTAGAGAACRAAGIPGVFPGGLTTGYLDIGAAQSQATGGTTLVIVEDD